MPEAERPPATGPYRLAALREGELDEQQTALWSAIAGGPRAATAVRPEGFLTGPFDVLLRTPDVGLAASELGAILRFSTTLGPRLTEIVVLTVAGHWRARFAWTRHADYGAREGLDADAIVAFAAGRDPGFADARDEAAWAVAHSLVTTGQVADEVYAAALSALGERTLVEAVALAGYYCLSSFLLNAFRVPLPEGVTVPWDES